MLYFAQLRTEKERLPNELMPIIEHSTGALHEFVRLNGGQVSHIQSFAVFQHVALLLMVSQILSDLEESDAHFLYLQQIDFIKSVQVTHVNNQTKCL